MTTRAVWKYDLPIHGPVEIEMPKGAQFLHVGAQADHPVIWALVDIEAPTVERKFVVLLTGDQWRDDPTMAMAYRGTVLLFDEAYVVHVFEGVEEFDGAAVVKGAVG